MLLNTAIFSWSHVGVWEGLIELFATTKRVMHRFRDHVVVTLISTVKVPATDAEMLSVGVSHGLRSAT